MTNDNANLSDRETQQTLGDCRVSTTKQKPENKMYTILDQSEQQANNKQHNDIEIDHMKAVRQQLGK